MKQVYQASKDPALWQTKPAEELVQNAADLLKAQFGEETATIENTLQYAQIMATVALTNIVYHVGFNLTNK
jgi:hypothetical protein